MIISSLQKPRHDLRSLPVLSELRTEKSVEGAWNTCLSIVELEGGLYHCLEICESLQKSLPLFRERDCFASIVNFM
jgi:hypothetical protein